MKWQNAVPSQNPHNIADDIGLINYRKEIITIIFNFKNMSISFSPCMKSYLYSTFKWKKIYPQNIFSCIFFYMIEVDVVQPYNIPIYYSITKNNFFTAIIYIILLFSY